VTDIFKFDVRVRERLNKVRSPYGRVGQQPKGCFDIEEFAVNLELDQPALGRADGSRSIA
jgi:hypothetical protein